MSKIKLAVLLGTTRRNNQSQKVARFVAQVAGEDEDFEVTFVDPGELDLPDDGNDEYAKDPKYTKITEESDAFFIVTPEYNHSFPGTLKRLIDSELKNYIHKPAAIAGVSGGRFAGVRAIELLVPVLREVGLVPTFTDVTVGNVGDAFDEDGQPKDDYIRKSIEDSLTELKWMSRTLSWGRENLESKYH